MIPSVIEIRLTLILHVVNYDSFREHGTNSTYMIHYNWMILSFSLVHSATVIRTLVTWFSQQLCYIIFTIGSIWKHDTIWLYDSFVHVGDEISFMLHVSNIWLKKIWLCNKGRVKNSSFIIWFLIISYRRYCFGNNTSLLIDVVF